MCKRSLSERPSMLRQLALLAMLFKLVMPAGFMPGNLLAGEWITLCPQGLPPGLLDQAAHHHGAGSEVDHGQTDDNTRNTAADHQQLCPLGSAFAMAGMVSHQPPCCSSASADVISTALLLDPAIAGHSYHARAPPV